MGAPVIGWFAISDALEPRFDNNNWNDVQSNRESKRSLRLQQCGHKVGNMVLSRSRNHKATRAQATQIVLSHTPFQPIISDCICSQQCVLTGRRAFYAPPRCDTVRAELSA